MIAGEDYILTVNLEQTGLNPEDLSLSLVKPSEAEFEPVELESEDISEVGLGYYKFPVPRAQLGETGTYLFRVMGYELDKVVERECLPRPLSSVPAPEVCLITGNIRDVSGRMNAFENVEIILRPLKLPAQFSGTFVLGNRSVTRTDFDGFFSIPAVRGATVIVEIKDAGIRFQAVVPDQDTIRIEDLMPSPTPV